MVSWLVGVSNFDFQITDLVCSSGFPLNELDFPQNPDSGKDKGGPTKGGFLNNMLFSWMMYDLYTHTINFIAHI